MLVQELRLLNKGEIFMIEVSAPGKLYIAGEYAVVETGHPAVIAAVDQFVTVTVGICTKSRKYPICTI